MLYHFAHDKIELNAKPKNNKLLVATVLLTVIAIILGILRSQYSDPESSTPAPYIGFLAFITAILSLIYNRHLIKIKSKSGNK